MPCWRSRRHPPRARNSPRAACPRRCVGPGGNAASTPWPPRSSRHCVFLSCTICSWSRTRWGAKRAHCWPRWTPNAPTPITSFPGLGDLTGARVLAEIGDDRTRFADARGLKAFAGSAPV
ncbi:MAG: transposase, partial [Sciscionella sp.]